MTSRELADSLGVAESRVSEWVNGKKRPGLDKLALLSAHLGASIDFLVHGPRVTAKGVSGAAEAALRRAARAKQQRSEAGRDGDAKTKEGQKE